MKQKILITEKKTLRRIFGPAKERDGNGELRQIID